jgi:succinate dehydrogenase / fumarate reductase, membrane anchor subunit
MTAQVTQTPPHVPPAAAPARAAEPPAGRMRRGVIDSSRGGMWAWLFQRVTAVVLIVGLVTHLVATHIVNLGHLSFLNIGDRLGSTFFVIIDVSLLAASIFHGLNGARMVVLDYRLQSVAARRALAIALWVFGSATFVYGMWALWPWISK